MVDYEKLYYLMVDAVEHAIEAIERQSYDAARDILIDAEQSAEELYISAEA